MEVASGDGENIQEFSARRDRRGNVRHKVKQPLLRRGSTGRLYWPFLISPLPPPSDMVLAYYVASAWADSRTYGNGLYVCVHPGKLEFRKLSRPCLHHNPKGHSHIEGTFCAVAGNGNPPKRSVCCGERPGTHPELL